MTVNKFFHNPLGVGSTSEQNLDEDLIIEMIQMAGNDKYYIPRTLFNKDTILNEDVNSKFEKYYTIEMYQDNATEWGGQGQYLGKFGLEVNNSVDLIVSRKRFLKEVGEVKPKEGDLIYDPLSKSLFQIDFVEYEKQSFYQLSKIYTFLLKCSLYTYSYEDFDTGIGEVDVDLDSATFEDKFKNNDEINTVGKEIEDFSESNPFGEVVDNT